MGKNLASHGRYRMDFSVFVVVEAVYYEVPRVCVGRHGIAALALVHLFLERNFLLVDPNWAFTYSSFFKLSLIMCPSLANRSWTIEMWFRIPDPPPVYWQKFTIFSYALPDDEAFLVAVARTLDSSEWEDIVVKMPNQPWNAACSSTDIWSDRGLTYGGWHHFALTNSPIRRYMWPILKDGDWESKFSLYLDGNRQWTYRPGYLNDWMPPDGGSVIIGQGQSSKDTLHHSCKHYHPAGMEYEFFLSEVRLWRVQRTSEDILATWNQRLKPTPSVPPMLTQPPTRASYMDSND